ncbi:Spc19-domain-containing protein [Radiomyces spectabilis]|uniref:Spc19-domain-containing protein n=1 Tax=Radiomyces spectabilis TaxID=64574 RepID=UPI00221F2784|nr:Spc19-domain-containing protein [Radiomyces spectabilis]KAI8364668.1 Spc19-domain-containing protein [Radiomyces spectabilis]
MLRAIDPPPDRTAARKRKRDNDVFDGSANVIASLEGSTSKLESTLKALSSSVHTLRDVTEDFGRIRKVTQFERKYELVTQSDIGVAQSAIAVELAPQIQSLIQEAEILLNKLAAEEAALETKVYIYNSVSKEGIFFSKAWYDMRKLEEQEQQVNRLRTESASLPSRTDINQRKRRTDEHMKQLKRLRQKKASLSRAIQQSQHEVKAKDDALTRLEKQTLDLEPQLKMVENAYNANIPTKEQESRRQQLLDELTDLKRKTL